MSALRAICSYKKTHVHKACSASESSSIITSGWFLQLLLEEELKEAKGPRKAFTLPNLREGVCGKGGLWGNLGGGRRFPPLLSPRQGWAEGPKLGLCCPLVPELIPRPQLLPSHPTWTGMCAQECMGVWPSQSTGYKLRTVWVQILPTLLTAQLWVIYSVLQFCHL